MTSSFSQATLEILSLNLLGRFDDLLEEFGLDLRQGAYMYAGACPIHDGDNRTAFNLYKEADSDGRARAGYWCCRTKGCQNKFRPTPIGFVRGVLSKNNPMTTFKETIDWVCGFLGESIDGIMVDETRVEQRAFAGTVAKISKKSIVQSGIPRLQVRSKLEIPARFFLDRLYPAEILDRFDVGYCPDMTKPMGGRVVVPVYENGLMVACSGRTVQNRCCKCGMFHAVGVKCPHSDPYKYLNFCKWRHNGQINSFLYNFASAKPYIKKTGTVVIVEGPGDVWRLVQYGVENVVALTGSALSDSQQIILEMSGASTVIDLLDNDEAGNAGSKELVRKLGLYMKVVKPTFEEKDVGEMGREQFKIQILPTIEKFR